MKFSMFKKNYLTKIFFTNLLIFFDLILYLFSLKRTKKINSFVFAILSIFKKNQNLVIFDVGANEGQTVKLFLKIFPNSKFYCFEPSTSAFNHLQKFVLKEKNNKIKIFNHGLYSKVCKKKLYSNKDFNDVNSFLKRSKVKYYDPSLTFSFSEDVENTTLDKFAQKEKIKNIDILKIDTQGSDLEILKGASFLIGGQRIKAIIIEAYFIQHYEKQPLISNIINFLIKKNYFIYNLNNLFYSDNGQVRYCDLIFINKELRAQKDSFKK